jgi:hypothetical protein
MRPGSYLVSEILPRKLSSAERKKLKDSGSLRWKHVSFYLHQEGIAADVTFVHIKGNNSPKLAIPEPTRKFTFWPTRGQRLHLDVAALLFALAYSRGLFLHTIDEVDQLFTTSTSQQRVVLPMRHVAYDQPVFLADDQSKPLSGKAFIDQLRTMCVDANLLGNYSPYSWRRGRLTTLQRLGGT